MSGMRFILPAAITWPASTADWLLCIALTLILAHLLMWFAYVALCYERRQWLSRLLDPGSYPDGSLWQALHRALLARLSLRAQQSAIPSGGRYRLVGEIGRGDVSDVFLAVDRHDRPIYLKFPRRAAWGQLLGKEQAVLGRLHRCQGAKNYGRYLPRPVADTHLDDPAVSGLRMREGLVSAVEIRHQYPAGVDPRHIGWMFNRVLEALGFIHHSGQVHGAVLPPHLLYGPDDHGLQLIDWIQSEPIGKTLRLVPRAYQSWYPPECFARQGATPATDLYLAANSMIWIAGGDPIQGRIPKALPHTFSALLKACTDARPTHRPQDAWALRAQFRELLEAAFGPPKFCPLLMG